MDCKLHEAGRVLVPSVPRPWTLGTKMTPVMMMVMIMVMMIVMEMMMVMMIVMMEMW